MRIISGKYKGKNIVAPKNLPTRPTTDFAKEALFNILNNEFYFEDLTVLDLFTGTGNISYEFASRGTKMITSVDQNYNCIRFIKQTIKQLNADEILPLKAEVFAFVDRCKQQFDIIFADPPYDLPTISQIPNLIFEKGILSPEGWLIIEHSKHTKLDECINYVTTKKYGNVNFSIFKQS